MSHQTLFGLTILQCAGLAALPIGLTLGGPAWAQDSAGGAGAPDAAGTPAAGQEAAPRPWYDLHMMPDPILDQVLLFYLSEARHGMTDIGEVLDTASRVRADDEYSWTREFSATAERVRGMAEAGERAGHPLGAGAAYLRAAAYYRAALHRHPDPTAARFCRRVSASDHPSLTSRAAGPDSLRKHNAAGILLPLDEIREESAASDCHDRARRVGRG